MIINSYLVRRAGILVAYALTFNSNFIFIRCISWLILIIAIGEFIKFTNTTYGKTVKIFNQINMGKYYDFQISREKKVWYKKLLHGLKIIILGGESDERPEIVKLRKYVSGPISGYLFYTYFLTLEITFLLMPLNNGCIMMIMIILQILIVMSLFLFLTYLYLPGLVMLALPIFGILAGNLILTSNSKRILLNSYDKSLYMFLFMMMTSIIFAWIISEISPMYLLQRVSGISGVLQILFVSLIGTLIMKYGLPALFFHTFPAMSPNNVSNELMRAGKKLNFSGNDDIKNLFIELLEDHLLKRNNDKFQQIGSYFSDYLMIASADFTISTMVMKHKQKKALILIRETPINCMSYDELKELMVIGGDSVEMSVWNDSNARKLILKNVEDSK
ncbi:hypothetical protein [Companilactobacillus nantensis]|uniref:Uncharacterized protein n=2 Tax=Companilactobacillus nantensis TaxID=305793 RepID=A0A0R1WC20_9LACO|nr:hypothetical protein [Companilactobacillus nantensis]KRM15502.1 hypothetical protein FD31_GL001217 [Companilactobacillus nantensis DSM 16982]